MSHETPRYLTKYDISRLLTLRAEQIAQGSPLFVEYKGETDYIEIAKRELKEKKLPIVIYRQLPNGTEEKCTVQTFRIMTEF